MTTLNRTPLSSQAMSDVREESGITPPRGTKYVPESEAELRRIKLMVTSYTETGYAPAWGPGPAPVPHHHFISFRLDGDQFFYMDLDTVLQDIRSRRIDTVLAAATILSATGYPWAIPAWCVPLAAWRIPYILMRK